MLNSVPQKRWNIGSKQQHDLSNCSGNTDIAIVDKHTGSGKLDESKQTCRGVEIEAGCRRDDGLVADVTPTLNQTGSSSIRSQHVTALSDEHAEVIANQSDAKMQDECPANRTTQGLTTEPRTQEPDDTVLLHIGRPSNQTVIPRQSSDNGILTDTPTPVSSRWKWKSQISPSTARTDRVVRRETESRITTGDIGLPDERSAPSDIERSSTNPDTAGTGSTLSARKRFASENEVDHISTRTFNVHPSVTVATKPNCATNVTHYETSTANTEAGKMQPNAHPSPTTGASSRLAENVRVEKSFSTTIAKYASEATKGIGISVRSSAANSDRTTDKKSQFDMHRLTSSATRTKTKPAIAHVIKMLSTHSQDLLSGTADTVSTDVDDSATNPDTAGTGCTLSARKRFASTNSSTIREDEVNNGGVVEDLISGTSADTSLAVRKHTDVSAARENENSEQPSKHSNCSAAEQHSSISETSRLPNRLNRTALSGLNDAISSDQCNSASVETESAASNVANPLGVKLVHVDRMMRSVPPVAPATIRSTGVATPAVQAQKLASMRDGTITSRLSTRFQTEPRSTPTAEKK